MSEALRKMREKRKISGLCVRCGKPMDRDGIYCTDCLNIINKETRERRAWYKSHKICPRCGKNDLIGDENVCLECGAREYTITMASRKRLGKEHFNKTHNEWARKKYAERVEKGICTRCGKRKADYGFKTCGICRAKDAETRRVRNGVKEKDWREQQGVCHFCDRPAKPGYKVCEEHYQMNIEKLKNEKCKEARKRLGKDNEKFFLK